MTVTHGPASFEADTSALMRDAATWHEQSDTLSTMQGNMASLHLDSSVFSFAGQTAATAYQQLVEHVTALASGGTQETQNVGDALEQAVRDIQEEDRRQAEVARCKEALIDHAGGPR